MPRVVVYVKLDINRGEKNMVAPVVAGAAVVAKLAYKPAMKLAKQLAKKYWSKGADKKAIVKEVREKGILEKFNAFKLKAKPKVDKPKQSKPFSTKTAIKNLEKYAKQKNLDIEGMNEGEIALKARQHIRANRPYEPRFRNALGGSVKKYAKGGGVRKAQTYG